LLILFFWLTPEAKSGPNRPVALNSGYPIVLIFFLVLTCSPGNLVLQPERKVQYPESLSQMAAVIFPILAPETGLPIMPV
jgi:hypothetical protein